MTGARKHSVSETIELRRVDRASVERLTAEAITGDGTYVWSEVGDHVFQSSRVFRPRWATVTGWVFTVGLLGAGFWLFLIKRTETCTFIVAEERARVKLTLTGALLPEARDRLQQVLTEAEGSRSVNVDADVVLPPPPTGAEIDLTRHVVALTQSELSSPPANVGRPQFGVRFADGERVRLAGVVFVGRDPIPFDDAGREVGTVMLADRTGTVSKTHFAVGSGSAGPWVEDLHSTNGTAIGTHVATARRLVPGERVAVRAGETIFFGDLTAEVLADIDRVVGSAPPSGPISSP